MRIRIDRTRALIGALAVLTLVASASLVAVRDVDIKDASPKAAAPGTTVAPPEQPDAAPAPKTPRARVADRRIERPTVSRPSVPVRVRRGGSHNEPTSPIPEISLDPIDYETISALSRPVYPKIVTAALDVPMTDGAALYVEVTRPDPAVYGEKKLPVILEASPYHGTNHQRTGTRIFPDPRAPDGKQLGLTGYFAPRGYAVVMVDLRGTGRSGGCLDHLGPKDRADLKTIVEWAAAQPWSNGRVGMTGHSYVGSTPSLAAATKPKGLVTIVPSAGLASMYDHQFQYGVPYLLQWLGPIEAYEELAIDRHLPALPPVHPQVDRNTGDNFGNDVESTGCGLPNSAITAGSGEVTGQYEPWHAARDWRDEAADADIPIFIIHGVNDDAARIPAAEWFFAKRIMRPGDKVWLGQWTHGGEAPGHPNRRYGQWQYALHAWFDKHLKQMDVDTGPPVEVFLNDFRVYTARGWGKRDATMTLHAGGGALTSSEPAEAGSVAFSAASFAGGAQFETEPLSRETVLVGLPDFKLHASVSGSQILHLIGTLYARDTGGSLRAMGYCAIQPLLRNGVKTVTPIVPGQEMELRPQCFTLAHRLSKGESIVLRIGLDSPHHVEWGAADARITVYTGPGKTSLRLPVVSDPLHRDLKLEQPE